MRNVLAVFCFIILTLVSTAVLAEGLREIDLGSEGLYVSGNIGASWLENSDIEGGNIKRGNGNIIDNLDAEAEFHIGTLFGGAFGYDFGTYRTEVEFGYRDNDIDLIKNMPNNSGRLRDLNLTGEATTLSYMLNTYIDFENDTALTPYVGAGLGIADIELDYNGEERDDTVFAYQAAVGVGYDINARLTLDAGYRYFATQRPDFDGIEGEYNDHNIALTVRYKFW